MINILEEPWIVEDAIKEDEMKSLVLSILLKAGLRYSRADGMEQPMASRFPHLGWSTHEGRITAYTSLESKQAKDYKRIKLKELLAAAENIINKQSKLKADENSF